jgi:cephalosporin-C deacetylase-like acetyl esterase
MYEQGFEYYPDADSVDQWVSDLITESDAFVPDFSISDPSSHDWPDLAGLPVQYAARHHRGPYYVHAFSHSGRPFHCLWQPAFNSPAPLVVHLPGYGAEMSAHPEIVAAGYNVLHINPLGYCGPDGFDFTMSDNPSEWSGWPHLRQTIDSFGTDGYRTWLLDCIRTVTWAKKLPEVDPTRLAFFGTSQGGGAALILSSIHRDRAVRCAAADQPFLTGFPLANGRGAYAIAAEAISRSAEPERAWRALGFIDTLSHAHRLTTPILLTAGGRDNTCPADTIETLAARLPGTRSLSFLSEAEHGYTPQFLFLLQAWLRMFA